MVKDVHGAVGLDVHRMPAEYRLKVFNNLRAVVEIDAANDAARDGREN